VRGGEGKRGGGQQHGEGLLKIFSVCGCVWMCEDVCVCVCVHLRVFVCMNVHIYACIHMH